MRQCFGPILVSGPSNVAVDNFEECIELIGRRVCDRSNEGMLLVSRYRPLVVRGYDVTGEVVAFECLLGNPEAKAEPIRSGPWKLPNSLAFWLAVCLGSVATTGMRDLHSNDSRILHELWDQLQNPELDALRDVAIGRISWAEYVTNSAVDRAFIRMMFSSLIAHADFLCLTPAITTLGEYAKFKREKAQGIVLDEASSVDRADLMCVWGNTLLPCFLIGDPRQLPPTVWSERVNDSGENRRHRLLGDAKVSAFEWIQGSGIRTFRLRTQLRMADDLFGYVAREAYPEIDFRHGPQCRADSPEFERGHILEAFVQKRRPGIRSFLPQRLLPIMLDCPGSDVTTNSTGSRKCPKQSTIALDFILDLVNTTNIDTNAIAIIAPYQSNVNLINRLRASPRYSPLSSMRPATTVDYFQGREADIVIAVMGTNSSSGPGFTCDAHRLNVMLTRQRCGLVIVADVTVVPSLGGPRRDKVLQDKRGSRCGEQVDVTMLWNVYNRLRTDGRIARCDSWSVPSLVSTPSRAWSSSLTTLWPQ